VRLLAREAGLPNWDWAASPCLRSRLALGVPATPANLSLVEAAEAAVRAALGVAPQEDMRVRALAGGAAAVELGEGPLARAMAAGGGGGGAAAALLREGLEARLLALGFASVAFRPFRSGSVAGLKLQT